MVSDGERGGGGGEEGWVQALDSLRTIGPPRTAGDPNRVPQGVGNNGGGGGV